MPDCSEQAAEYSEKVTAFLIIVLIWSAILKSIGLGGLGVNSNLGVEVLQNYATHLGLGGNVRKHHKVLPHRHPSLPL